MQPVAELLNEELTEDLRAEWPTNFGTLSDASMSEILTAFSAEEPGDVFMEEILKAFATMLPHALTAERLEEALTSWQEAKEEQEKAEAEQEAALFGEEGELRRAQVDKTDAETGAIKKPFAASPKSAGTPKERG